MATTPKSISGLTSAAAARVVLWQSREFVTVPGNAMGLQATIPATGLLPDTIGGTGMVLEVVGGVPVWVEPAVKFVVTGTFSGGEDDIDLSTWIAQGYTRFRAMWQNWSSSVDAALYVRFSNNAGSSFVTSGYGGTLLSAVTTTVSSSAGATTHVQVSQTSDDAGTSTGFIEFSVDGSAAEYFGQSKSINLTPLHAILTFGGHCLLSGTNAIRFLTSTGSHDGGTYTIHALRDF